MQRAIAGDYLRAMADAVLRDTGSRRIARPLIASHAAHASAPPDDARAYRMIFPH